MAILFKNGINVPDQHAVYVAKCYGVKQGEIDSDETAAEAWKRVEAACFQSLKRPVRQKRKRELVAEQQLTETFLTEIEDG